MYSAGCKCLCISDQVNGTLFPSRCPFAMVKIRNKAGSCQAPPGGLADCLTTFEGCSHVDQSGLVRRYMQNAKKSLGVIRTACRNCKWSAAGRSTCSKSAGKNKLQHDERLTAKRIEVEFVNVTVILLVARSSLWVSERPLSSLPRPPRGVTSPLVDWLAGLVLCICQSHVYTQYYITLGNKP